MTFYFKAAEHNVKTGEHVIEVYYTGYFPVANEEVKDLFVAAIYTSPRGIRVISKYGKTVKVDAKAYPISLDIYFDLQQEDSGVKP